MVGLLPTSPQVKANWTPLRAAYWKLQSTLKVSVDSLDGNNAGLALHQTPRSAHMSLVPRRQYQLASLPVITLFRPYFQPES